MQEILKSPRLIILYIEKEEGFSLDPEKNLRWGVTCGLGLSPFSHSSGFEVQGGCGVRGGGEG